MYEILDRINGPENLKGLSKKELIRLSVEIRDFLIKKVSENGGHLASNLGIVELTIALHYVFNSPEDKFIWDVSHQAYVHKILTGRKDQFDHLREYGGLSGFTKCSESSHDCFQSGHASNSISAAIGMAKARDIENKEYKVLPIIGDGALTGGMALEALNYLGDSKEDVTIIFNDNGMSIDKNIGAISKKLSRIRETKVYNLVKKDTKVLINKIPKVGKGLEKKLSKIKKGAKSLFLPNMLFEELGYKYIGPIDGHNIDDLIYALEHSKNLDGPIVIHTLTKKGKGYQPAEDAPENYHGIGGQKKKNPQTSSIDKWSNIFGQKVLSLAKENKNVFAITAAMPKGTGLLPFKEEFPARYIDVGIAEQNAAGMAAGLAMSGQKPYLAIYSTFLQRAYDQVIHDICIQNLPVVLCIDRAGLVGKDGETHHGVFDIAFLSTIPNLTFLSPKDKYELERMLEFSYDYEYPLAIRYPRGEAVEINHDSSDLLLHEVVKEGKECAIIATGKMVSRALEVASKMKKDVMVINQRVLKPIDYSKLKETLKGIEYLVTLEDHVSIGGLGSLINSNLSNEFDILNISHGDRFVTHGDTEELFEVLNLDVESVTHRIKEFISKQKISKIVSLD